MGSESAIKWQLSSLWFAPLGFTSLRRPASAPVADVLPQLLLYLLAKRLCAKRDTEGRGFSNRL